MMSAAPRERLRHLATATVGAAPADGTEPHLQLSPRAPNGGKTVGFLFSLHAPTVGSATATGTGFTVTVWRLNPTTGAYASSEAITEVAYGAQYVINEVPGGGSVYFQITNVAADGAVVVGVAEVD